MKWWPGECRPGDMLRVRNGSIYHYGVCVGENEIVQFGLPPSLRQRRPDSEQVVCLTDAEGFAQGQIIETACLDAKERRSRIPPRKTVALARARLGEGGYSLIHNNCEHFANECVFGVKRCTQEEETRRKWANRPILNVYVAALPEDVALTEVYPPARSAEILATRDEALRKSRYFAWKLLEHAVAHAFGYPFDTLTFRKALNGQWRCDRLYFSLACAEGTVAAAVSNGRVGLAVENADAFCGEYQRDPAALEAAVRRACSRTERESCRSAEDWLSLWTRKQSARQYGGAGRFRARAVNPARAPTAFRLPELSPPLALGLCADQLDSARFYQVIDGAASPIKPEQIRRG